MCRPFDSTPKNYEPNAGGHRGINTLSIPYQYHRTQENIPLTNWRNNG